MNQLSTQHRLLFKQSSKLILWHIMLIGILISCNSLQRKKDVKHQMDHVCKEENSLNFLVIGDWGRNGIASQKSVATQMGVEASKRYTHFVLTVGDNFYPSGVSSTSDAHWKSSFDAVYDAKSLQIPWYGTLGNHDYGGSVQAQIDFANFSKRWRMPARYYSFERTIPRSDKNVLFVVLDTSPFDKSLIPSSHTDLALQDTTAQLLWLKSVLTTSSAKWKVVVGHHPLYTTGMRRGLMQDFINTFGPIFEQYKVDAYFAGHDHDLQHQKPIGHTHYFVSGAGSEVRPVTWDSTQTRFAKSESGFMSVQVDGDTLTLQAINYQGDKIYKTYLTK